MNRLIVLREEEEEAEREKKTTYKRKAISVGLLRTLLVRNSVLFQCIQLY